MSSSFSNELTNFLIENHGKNIVFTNGCFDILHSGHVMYLNLAREQGDILILGLNSDLSVKKLKGDRRPINNQEERKYLLENLSSVSFVEIFEEETPLNLIKFIKPSLLVKGGDWKTEQIVGSDFVMKNGGTVKSLAFKQGFSTTNIIDRIRNL